MTTGRYWMQESTGVLRPVIEAYLAGEQLTDSQISTMRRYLFQWIHGDMFGGPDIERLRIMVCTIDSRDDIHRWITRATAAGADPL